MSITIKIVGLILIAVGLLTLRNFPGIGQSQREEMALGGILIGLILFLIGVVILVFG